MCVILRTVEVTILHCFNVCRTWTELHCNAIDNIPESFSQEILYGKVTTVGLYTPKRNLDLDKSDENFRHFKMSSKHL